MAEMLNIPYKEILIESCDLSNEIITLKRAFNDLQVDAIITGGIRSEFQRYKFNRAAALAGVRCFNPLWRLAPLQLMNELLENNFYIIFVSVAAMGFERNLLGKRITQSLISRIRQQAVDEQISVTGEGGEYESFVLDAPFFPSRIEIEEAEVHWDESREIGYYEIFRVKLISKKSN